MSIPVPLEELLETMGRYQAAFLLTAAGGRPHAVAVRPAGTAGRLVMDGGRRTSTNVAAQPEVALLWPPVEPGGYSLIVDGTAVVADGQVVVTPSHAVLHRPAPDDGAGGGCGHDCQPVEI